MEDWDAGGDRGFQLGKRQSEKGEVDYKTKAGTAWSHSYLNQKPWHPLSYPNQRRKWIAEQTSANRERRAEEVSREFAQEQEFFRQTALFSKKEKEKMEMMKAVSFMYVRPPGYNAESAKVAEVADEKKISDGNNAAHDLSIGTTSMHDKKPEQDKPWDPKSRPKDVFGRSLPTESEFEVLKNAPRLETGMPARVKPFGVEIRNVRCVRCGTFGHQSGDRECPLKDAIMPNEESRLKRDDPLTAIMAQTSSAEPVKWELKQKPGMSPPRGGFQVDDPNQQIVADEIFDEYGGFLSCGDIPALLTNFSSTKSKKSKNKSKHKNKPSASRRGPKFEPESSNFDNVRENKMSKDRNAVSSDCEIDGKKRSHSKHGRHLPEVDRERRRLRNKHDNSSDSDVDKDRRRSRKNHAKYSSKSDFDKDRRSMKNHSSYSSESEADTDDGYSDFEINWKKRSKHERHLSKVGREKRRLRNKHDNASDSNVDKEKNRSGKKLTSYSLESEVDRDDASSDSEIDWKKSRSKHERLGPEVDREKRSRNKHDNFSDSYVDKDKKRSMKKHASYSIVSEVDSGRGHRMPRNKHGNNSSDSDVDRQRKMSANKHEKLHDIEVNIKWRSLRNMHNRI